MHKPKNVKNILSFHVRPKTKTRGQLVGIADYMGESLKENDMHTQIYKCVH